MNEKEQKPYVFRIQFTTRKMIPITIQKFREIIWTTLSKIPEFKDISFQEFDSSFDLAESEIDHLMLDELLNPDKKE